VITVTTLPNTRGFMTLALVGLALVLSGSLAAQPSDLSVERPQGRSPGASTRLGIGWETTSLVLDMPNGAQFELLIPIDGRVPVCGVNEDQGGGLAIFWRSGKVAEYGCWLALQRGNDSWVQFEMNSGIAMRMPLRAFSKRPIRE
jgi:hypothetical protein